LAWHHLQYVIGLTQLGYEVAFFEDSGDDEWSCYDPVRRVTDKDPSYGLDWTANLFERMEVPGSWAYFDKHRSRWLGPMSDGGEAYLRSADIVLNLSGSNVLRPWSAMPPVRVLVDTDPAFTQVANLLSAERMSHAKLHNSYFTFGENFGVGSSIPDDGLPWRATRQPVVLDLWDLGPAPPGGPYTTVMQWNSYPAVEYGGRRFGLKSDSFDEYARLPGEVPVRLEMAAGGGAPTADLEAQGWSLVDPLATTRDAWTFQEYLRSSRAEFSVAKHGYVVTNSGWFSERSANYLASGRPVITQETGFSDHIPVGDGLLAFGTPAEAIAAIQSVEGDYARHANAARDTAAQWFDSRKVLRDLMEALP
jgi:hypothetical protein